jgi:hypothetical protein
MRILKMKERLGSAVKLLVKGHYKSEIMYRESLNVPVNTL